MSPAVVGGKVPIEAQSLDASQRTEARHHLMVTVTPEQYAALGAGRFDVGVRRVALREHWTDAAYIVQVKVASEWLLIALDASDILTLNEYEEWARIGQFALVFQNFRNGRMLTAVAPWPSAYAGEVRRSGAPLLVRTIVRRNMCDEPAVRAFVETEFRREMNHLACYTCDAAGHVRFGPNH